MNSTGCSFLLLAVLAVLVGFVPFLVWTNYVMALPLALISLGMFTVQAKKQSAQAADYTFFWIALGLLIIVIGRLVMVQA